MLEKLYSSTDNLARHRDGPFAEDRDRYLDHCARAGFSIGFLRVSARALLGIASELDASPGRSMTLGQIQAAADRWLHCRPRCLGRYGHGHPRTVFINLAVEWFRFLGRFSEAAEAPVPFSELMRDFAVWMEDERGLSRTTITYRGGTVRRFLGWYGPLGRPFSEVSLTDIDAFLAKYAKRGWSRRTIANEAGMLRAFFRHAGNRGWCPAEIANGIKGPRLYSEEGLPVGPSWEDVKRLLASLHTDHPGHIRDLPMMMLCAIYGLRPSEVARLRLEDLDWEHDRLLVRRLKVDKAQEYPLIPQVGNAILRYLKEVRPQCAHREVFLTRVAPLRPVTPMILAHTVRRHLLLLGIRSSKYGPYALRHACATHLASQGLSFKVIGDHLGHASPNSTRIYAKVDLPMLRRVATLDLGGVL